MQTAALDTFAETEAASHFPTGCGVGLDSQPRMPHYSGTLPLVRKAPARIPAADSPDDDMHDQRTDVRSNVVRMLSRYVRLKKDSSMRSVSGKIAMDEKRVQRPRKLDLAAEIEDLSSVEAIDAFGRAYLRQRIYASPELPKHLIGDDGRPKPRTLSLRDAVQIVRGRPSRSHGNGSNVRDFISDVGRQLKRLPPKCAEVVEEVAAAKIERVVTRNKLQRARSDYGRLSGGGKAVRFLREQKAAEVANLATEERALDDTVKSKSRTKEHTDGMDLLAIYCTESPEVEAACFGHKD